MKKSISLILLNVVAVFNAYAAPQPFNSPDAAAEALMQAAADKNMPALTKIFGPKLIQEIKSGDPIADRLHLEKLSAMMKQSKLVVAGNNALRVIEVGQARWPFPVPLTERDGRWYFNEVLGIQEIQNRHIGENELRAVKVAQFFVDAQELYRAQDRDGDGRLEYAQNIVSSAGKKDGLYWKRENGSGTSPFAPLAEIAKSHGYVGRGAGTDRPFQGYFYKVLTKQGAHARGGAKNYISDGSMSEGFALLAYPSRWGVGGVMSFIVSKDGTVYQKSLGENTLKNAAKIDAFDPDDSWEAVKADE